MESMRNRDNIVKSLQIWGTFFVTRGLPTPDQRSIDIAKEEHKNAYIGDRDFKTHSVTDELIDEMGKRFGNYCKDSINNSVLKKDSRIPWNIKESHVS